MIGYLGGHIFECENVNPVPSFSSNLKNPSDSNFDSHHKSGHKKNNNLNKNNNGREYLSNHDDNFVNTTDANFYNSLEDLDNVNDDEKYGETLRICHVTQFRPCERKVSHLLDDVYQESDNSFMMAKSFFEQSGSQLVGFFRTVHFGSPLLPTKRDLARQAALQRLVPDSVSIILSPPTYAFTHRPHSFISSHSPNQAFIAFQSTLSRDMTDDSESDSDDTENFSIDAIVGRQLICHKKLRPVRCLSGILDQGYTNPAVLKGLRNAILVCCL